MTTVPYIIAIEDSSKPSQAKLQQFVNASWMCDVHGCTLINPISMQVRATTTDTISIILPDGCVVSATGETWAKWLICGKELLAACELGLVHIESDVKTPNARETVVNRIRTTLEEVNDLREVIRTPGRG